jgi:hypothetical protein
MTSTSDYASLSAGEEEDVQSEKVHRSESFLSLLCTAFAFVEAFLFCQLLSVAHVLSRGAMYFDAIQVHDDETIAGEINVKFDLTWNFLGYAHLEYRSATLWSTADTSFYRVVMCFVVWIVFYGTWRLIGTHRVQFLEVILAIACRAMLFLFVCRAVTHSASEMSAHSWLRAFPHPNEMYVRYNDSSFLSADFNMDIPSENEHMAGYVVHSYPVARGLEVMIAFAWCMMMLVSTAIFTVSAFDGLFPGFKWSIPFVKQRLVVSAERLEKNCIA